MNLIIVNVATGRDARAVTSTMAEQFWREGQQRVNGESGQQASAEMDITFVPNNADARKTLSRALLFYRHAAPCPKLHAAGRTTVSCRWFLHWSSESQASEKACRKQAMDKGVYSMERCRPFTGTPTSPCC